MKKLKSEMSASCPSCADCKLLDYAYRDDWCSYYCTRYRVPVSETTRCELHTQKTISKEDIKK